MSGSRSRASGPFKNLLKYRSYGSVVFALVLAFYVAWPLYAGYGIKSSLDEADTAGLTTRVDFPSVRVSLRPAVQQKVDQIVTDMLRKAGTIGGALSDPIKARVMPRIVDGVLATLVTPEMLIRLHASGKSLKEAIEGMALEKATQADGLGSFMVSQGEQGGDARSKLEEIAGAFGIDTKSALGGAGAKTVDNAAETDVLPAKGGGAKPKYGVGNIKNFSLDGPFGLSFGVARDPKARKADLTAEMRFVDGTWKLTGLKPAL